MSGHALWYLTRGAGVVTLLLLTASLCLGIAGTTGIRSARMPRFGIGELHRNLTLLAVAFLGLHIATTVADSYTPIGLRDAFVPFVSSYRPVWLGLGALACDLVVALVVTSLLRLRLGFRAWRRVHWLAYACWPVAFAHAVGTGSDPRTAWLQALAAVSLGAVIGAVALRLIRGRGGRPLRLGLGAIAGAVVLLGWAWYRSGPGAPGWAARAGTPAALLGRTAVITPTTGATTVAFPTSFSARLAGTVTQTSAAGGLVDVHLDSTVRGGVEGRLRLVLKGIPIDDGGVSMTASGVAFAAAGTDLYQGHITGLSGNELSARLADRSGRALELTLVVAVDPSSGSFSGTVRGNSLA